MVKGTPPRWTINPPPRRPRWSEAAAPQVFSGLGPCDPVMDFIIREEGSCGYPGFINLIGIESPGLTACLAIAKHIEDNLIKDGK